MTAIAGMLFRVWFFVLVFMSSSPSSHFSISFRFLHFGRFLPKSQKCQKSGISDFQKTQKSFPKSRKVRAEFRKSAKTPDSRKPRISPTSGNRLFRENGFFQSELCPPRPTLRIRPMSEGMHVPMSEQVAG